MSNEMKRWGKKIIDGFCFLLLAPSYCRPKKAINEERIQKIILINLQGIGDILMTTPFLSALREKYPMAQIDYLCYKENGVLLENDPRINTLLKRQEENIFSTDFLKTIKMIQQRKYDLVLNLFHAQHSALLTVLSNAEYKMGNLWSTASTSNNLAVKRTRKTWDVRENCKNIAEQLGITIKGPAALSLSLEKASENKRYKEIKNRKIIAINPFAHWISKKWPKEYWQQLIKKIAEDKKYHEYVVAVIGTEEDKEEAEEVLEKIEKKRRENLCGKYSLKNLAAALKHIRLFITTDTGPLHIALAVQTKTIGLFGVTDPDILVNGAKNIEIISKYDQCPKKFRFNHNNEPPDWEQSCMKRISVDEVMVAVEKILYGRK